MQQYLKCTILRHLVNPYEASTGTTVLSHDWCPLTWYSRPSCCVRHLIILLCRYYILCDSCDRIRLAYLILISRRPVKNCCQFQLEYLACKLGFDYIIRIAIFPYSYCHIAILPYYWIINIAILLYNSYCHSGFICLIGCSLNSLHLIPSCKHHDTLLYYV